MRLFGLSQLNLFRLIFSRTILIDLPVEYYSFYEPNNLVVMVNTFVVNQ
jgi:hypothetical protein